MAGFLIDPSRGETPESLRRKRQVVDALAAQTRRVPSDIGEGLSALGAGLSARFGYDAMDQAEREGNAAGNAKIASIADAYLRNRGGGPGTPPSLQGQGEPTPIPVEMVKDDDNAMPNTAGMNQRLADLASDFVQDHPGTSISSGFRSTADQARLYADRANNSNPVARPGTSNHERGMAVDISGMSPTARALLPEYGLAQPVRNDPPHVELAGGSALPANAQPTQGQLPSNPRGELIRSLLNASNDPWVAQSKAGAAIVNTLLQSELKQQDPAHALQLEELRLKVDALRNPNAKSTDAQRNLAWRAREAGLEPGTPEYQKFMATGGEKGISVNVDTGTIPQGYQATRDANGRIIRYDPIPGGPKDTAKADAARSESRATSTDIITGAAQKARDAINSSVLPATGTAGALLSGIGETGAAEVNRQVDAIKANAKVENLQAMRAASPTGGALGAVSDSENAMLAAKAGALDPKSPHFLRDLDDYERSLLRTIHGKDAGDKIYQQTRPNKDGWSSVGGVKIRRKQ